MSEELKPCPKCGSKNLNTYAFNLSSDAGICCEDCGFGIEEEVPWEGLEVNLPEDDTNYKHAIIRAHDNKAWNILSEKWNNLKR